MKDIVKRQLQNTIAKAGELLVLLDEINCPEAYLRFIESLSGQAEFEMSHLVSEITKDIAAGRVGCGKE